MIVYARFEVDLLSAQSSSLQLTNNTRCYFIRSTLITHVDTKIGYKKLSPKKTKKTTSCHYVFCYVLIKCTLELSMNNRQKKQNIRQKPSKFSKIKQNHQLVEKLDVQKTPTHSYSRRASK